MNFLNIPIRGFGFCYQQKINPIMQRSSSSKKVNGGVPGVMRRETCGFGFAKYLHEIMDGLVGDLGILNGGGCSGQL